MIQIHKEGYMIIILFSIILVIINIALAYFRGSFDIISILILVFSLIFIVFVMAFFRSPDRQFTHREGIVYAPADGTIVAIEEVEEPEYFKDRRLQVSIFMSVWNVHVNWYPVTGKVNYMKYHPGKYLLARHPKSSELNERTSLVIETGNHQEILIRQIAGYVARRVVYYTEEGQNVTSGNQMGFIKFGSRVDIFLPLNTKVNASIGEKVKGLVSEIAVLP